MPVYDVIVVGGGPIGLSAAYQCAVKQGKTVLVLEQFTYGTEHGSSAGYSRQFRICYSERNLCNLAVNASKEWDTLMSELDDYTLMQRTGTLWFGDADITSSEGNIDEAIANLDALNQEYTELTTKEEIHEKFPFISGAINDIENPKALFVPDGGTVNTPGLVQCLYREISKCSGCKLMKTVRVTCIDHSCPDQILVTTSDKVVHQGQKLILTPGTYINNTLSTLKPAFSKVIDFDIYLWSSTYFKIARSSTPHPVTWPTWYFFGNKKNDDEPIDENLYYGFPVEHPTPAYVRVSSAFISGETFHSHLYPKHVNDRPLDRSALQFTSSFVANFMPDLDSTSIDKMETTCVAGFTKQLEGTDNSGGIVLDFLPDSSNRIVLTAGGWCMKYVPIMGIILAQLALTGTTDYSDDIEPMNIGREILINSDVKSKKLTSSEISAKFRKLCGWF